MDKDKVIAKLREHQPELKAAGVEHLFLHELPCPRDRNPRDF